MQITPSVHKPKHVWPKNLHRNALQARYTCWLRHSKDDWTVTSHYDDEMPRFVRQYCIQNQATGEKKRVFLHEIFEKNTTTYQELQAFFRQQTTSQPANEPANEPTDQVRDLNRIAKKSRRKPFVNNWPVSVVSLRAQN